jgi:hypothetical protein
MPHRLAELAIAGNVDAKRLLPSHHLQDRRSQLFLETLLIGRCAGLAGAISFDQLVGTRQAAGVTRQDAVGAHSHHSSP